MKRAPLGLLSSIANARVVLGENVADDGEPQPRAAALGREVGQKEFLLLIVDDEPGIRQSLSGVLDDEGFQVEAVESGEACLDALAARHPRDLVLLDIWLPGIDGLETLSRIQEIPAADRPVVVMISGHGTIDTAVKATKLGAYDFLEKPLSIDRVLLVAKHALEHRRLRLENEQLRESVSGQPHIVGDSVPMKALRQQLA